MPTFAPKKNVKFGRNAFGNIEGVCVCAESSATSVSGKRRRSSSKGCAGWNIADTTARAWRPSTGSHLHLHKRAGRIARLAAHLEDHPAPGTTGIGHTRWATHGPANDRNAHPHLGGDGVVAVVHNGVIENYAALKRQLIEEGFVFHSDTDTEVIAHLIARHLNGEGLIGAVSEVLPLLKGTYGLAAVSRLEPGVIVGARLGSPLVLGVGDGECFLASDPSALGRLRPKSRLPSRPPDV